MADQPANGLTSDRIATARGVLKIMTDRTNSRSIADPTQRDLAHRLGSVTGLKVAQIMQLLGETGIVDPLKGALTQERTDAFLDAVSRTPIPEPKPKRKKPPLGGQPEVPAAFAESNRARVDEARRQLLRHAGRPAAHVDFDKLVQELAVVLQLNEGVVEHVLDECGVVSSQSWSVTRQSIDRFTEEVSSYWLPAASSGSSLTPSASTPLPSADDASDQRGAPATTVQLASVRRILLAARNQFATAAPNPSQETVVRLVAKAAATPTPDVEKLMRKHRLHVASGEMTNARINRFLISLRAAPERGTAPRRRPPRSPAAAAAAPSSVSARSLFPACRRLVEGNSTGDPAVIIADYYLALAELTLYRSTAQSQSIAEIAADRFGVHADAATGARLTTRAKDAWQAGEGGVQLDQLSRLERRLRGVFYDGHLDRVTAWDSSSGTPLLYTCSGAELRTAAAGALENGDLVPPVMRRQVVSDTYEPTGPEDPALVLAVAAEQLGRQASRALHPTAPRIITIEETKEQPLQTRGASTARTASAATWVQPVSGNWGGLVLEQMESSYTRHRAGPRSRAATTVREHLRRAPGTSKSEAPTIPVRSHPRRGTGPGIVVPKVTKVSSRHELWR